MDSLAACPTIDRVAQLAREGSTIDAIASELGLHRSSVYRRMCAAGVAAGRRMTRVSPGERLRITELLEQDHSRREVARLTGRGLGTVGRIGRALQGPEVHRRLRSARRCTKCGHVVVVDPCVICTARNAHTRQETEAADTP